MEPWYELPVTLTVCVFMKQSPCGQCSKVCFQVKGSLASTAKTTSVHLGNGTLLGNVFKQGIFPAPFSRQILYFQVHLHLPKWEPLASVFLDSGYLSCAKCRVPFLTVLMSLIIIAVFFTFLA